MATLGRTRTNHHTAWRFADGGTTFTTIRIDDACNARRLEQRAGRHSDIRTSSTEKFSTIWRQLPRRELDAWSQDDAEAPTHEQAGMSAKRRFVTGRPCSNARLSAHGAYQASTATACTWRFHSRLRDRSGLSRARSSAILIIAISARALGPRIHMPMHR